MIIQLRATTSAIHTVHTRSFKVLIVGTEFGRRTRGLVYEIPKLEKHTNKVKRSRSSWSPRFRGTRRLYSWPDCRYWRIHRFWRILYTRVRAIEYSTGHQLQITLSSSKLISWISCGTKKARLLPMRVTLVDNGIIFSFRHAIQHCLAYPNSSSNLP